MQLTTNFNKSEFDSKDGSPMPARVLENVRILARNLQVLRNHTGKSITINSGYRSEAHNKKIGGASQSQHLLGKASDIQVEGMKSEEVYQLIEKLINQRKMKEGGLGLYNNFVHYDIRGEKKRWNFSTKQIIKTTATGSGVLLLLIFAGYMTYKLFIIK